MHFPINYSFGGSTLEKSPIDKLSITAEHLRNIFSLNKQELYSRALSLDRRYDESQLNRVLENIRPEEATTFRDIITKCEYITWPEFLEALDSLAKKVDHMFANAVKKPVLLVPCFTEINHFCYEKSNFWISCELLDRCKSLQYAKLWFSTNDDLEKDVDPSKYTLIYADDAIYTGEQITRLFANPSLLVYDDKYALVPFVSDFFVSYNKEHKYFNLVYEKQMNTVIVNSALVKSHEFSQLSSRYYCCGWFQHKFSDSCLLYKLIDVNRIFLNTLFKPRKLVENPPYTFHWSIQLPSGKLELTKEIMHNISQGNLEVPAS